MKKLISRIKPTTKIKVGKKLIKTINYFTDEELLTISNDIETSKELILLFLSFFTAQSVNFQKSLVVEGIQISKVFYAKLFGTYKHQYIYKSILELLRIGTKNGSIVYLLKQYSVESHRAKTYTLTERYIGKGYDVYNLKINKAQAILQALKEINLNKIKDDIISQRELDTYLRISIPSNEEIKELAKEKGYNKNKQIIFRKSKNFNPDTQVVYSALEEQFNYYTEDNDYIIPIKSEHGRVYTSFNLISSFIRKDLIKMDGEDTVEIDFSALHPNLLLNMYGSDSEKKNRISHTKISETLNVERTIIKKKHLSFFNEKVSIMKSKSYSDLFNYYTTNYPVMMKNLINDKVDNHYKITSHKVIKKETELIENIYKRINKNIPLLYIFDAIKVKKSDANQVALVIENIIKDMNLNLKTDYVIDYQPEDNKSMIEKLDYIRENDNNFDYRIEFNNEELKAQLYIYLNGKLYLDENVVDMLNKKFNLIQRNKKFKKIKNKK